MGGLPVQTGAAGFESMRFVDAEHYLALQTGDLYLGDLDGGKSLIDEGVSDFDFGW